MQLRLDCETFPFGRPGHGRGEHEAVKIVFEPARLSRTELCHCNQNIDQERVWFRLASILDFHVRGLLPYIQLNLLIMTTLVFPIYP